jgi:MFS family permease
MAATVLAAPAAKAGTDPDRWTAGALGTTLFLGIAAGVQMSDRGLQATLLSQIQAEFRVGDAMIGALQGLAGVLVASAVAVPVARLADRFSRRAVLVGLIAAWTALTALSALAFNFPLFFIGRAASGVTEFAMIPIVYSLIPDLAPDRHRVAANLVFAALMAAGASAGFYFGAAIVDAAGALLPVALSAWRRAFLLLALAGLPLLVAAALTVDPPRRVSPADVRTDASLAAFLRERWRAVGLFIGVAGSLAIAVQALNPLIAMALERRFGAGLATIGHALGLITFGATIGCLPVAGIADRWLGARWGRAARPLVMGAGALAAAVPAAALLVAADLSAALVAVAAFLFLTCIANALVPTVLQDLTPANLRARSFAVWSFAVSVFCAVGPVLAGLLSDLLLGDRLLVAIAVTALPALLLSAACAGWAVRGAGQTAT